MSCIYSGRPHPKSQVMQRDNFDRAMPSEELSKKCIN